MLRLIKHLRDFRLGAQDEEFGRIKDIYFEDQNWTVRYLVADTNTWLPGRKVLISPYAVKRIRDEDKVIEVALTREQIRNSPSMDEDKPVSRQYEQGYYAYYNWPYYWHGPALWGPSSYPAYSGMTPGTPPQTGRDETADPSLRSTEAVTDYYINARDGEIGHVEDFVFDDHDWVMRFFVVDTRNWWPGKRVLIATDWIETIDWSSACVSVNVDREVIKSAPEFRSSEPVTREFEARLFAHYHREPYWAHKAAA